MTVSVPAVTSCQCQLPVGAEDSRKCLAPNRPRRPFSGGMSKTFRRLLSSPPSVVPNRLEPNRDDDEYHRKPGLFWVRHEHCREGGQKVKSVSLYNRLTPSEILQVFMGKTIGTYG